MIKRIIVAGCRDYEDYDSAKKYIEMCIKRIRKNTSLYLYRVVAKSIEKNSPYRPSEIKWLVWEICCSPCKVSPKLSF